MDWHRLPGARWGWRPLGVVLLVGCYAAGHAVLALGSAGAGNPSPLDYALGLIAFLCFSSGSALVIHGHHLFDTVEVSERWRAMPPPPVDTPARPTASDEPSRFPANDLHLKKIGDPPFRTALAETTRTWRAVPTNGW